VAIVCGTDRKTEKSNVLVSEEASSGAIMNGQHDPGTGKKIVREIRINPIVPSQSVLVATARSMRPKKEEAPAPHDERSHSETCPFCIGNEAKTPPAIAQVPEEGPWQLRIVENLYPVLGDDRENPHFAFGLQQTIDGYGRHEVVIDHASHGIRMNQMSEQHLTLLLSTYRARMDQLYHSNPRLKYVLVFKNFGPAAGASIPHTHSQIIAMPVVPDNVQAEVRNSSEFHQESRRCIFCSLIDEALTFEATLYDRTSGEIRRKINVGQFVIDRTGRFVAIKPFASRYEWEVHILPLQHQPDFLDSSAEDLADLARILKRTMERLNRVLGGVQYNFFVHSLPHGDEYASTTASYHWHIEICPRTSIPTGFELGSGLFVNTVCPEDAAEKLRSAIPPE
jgi:UDPglucose--hexose-1-phosphate uridylyltransferase